MSALFKVFLKMSIIALPVSFAATQTTSVPGSASGCDSERTTVINEYITQHTLHRPQCADFTNSAHSPHFPFAVLNTGDYHWALIQPSLLEGAECIYRGHEGSPPPLQTNSAYRNPLHNIKIAGAATESQHIYGDAIDLQTTQSEWVQLREVSKSCKACVEPSAFSPGHLHADWRGKCPGSW
jgi:hypothetical protein